MKKRLYLVHAQGRYGENTYVPLSVGCLWAYARTFPEIAEAYEMVDFLYLKEPIDKAVARLDAPDIVGLAHYIWNAEWNKQFAAAVKKKWPACTIIVGGVQVPDESPRILAENRDFDFAIYGEGEGAFADFLRVRTDNVDYSTCGSLIWRQEDGRIVVNPRRDFVPLDDLRSPYLDGVFDKMWEREPRWQVLQETSRGCPYSSFSGDTIVYLPDRLIRFNEEKYNDKNTLPCSNYGHQHRIGINDERLISQGIRDCLKIIFNNGLSLTVTLDHPMMAVRNEKIVDVKARDLFIDDWIPVEIGQNNVIDNVLLDEPSKTKAEIISDEGFGQGRRVPDSVKLPICLDERVAWLVGYLIGDGCLPSDNRAGVLFCVTDKSRVMLKTLVSDLFGLDLHIYDSKFTTKMQNGIVYSRKVAQFFRESVGVEPGEAKLKVPHAIFCSPRTVVRAFLDGLWCADGYWPSDGESYLTTVSENLANECAALIYWIGDAAVVRKIKTRKGTGSFANVKPFCYRVEWHGSECRSRIKGKPCIASRVPAIRHTYRSRTGELCLRQTPQQRLREGSPREVLRYFEPGHLLLDPRFVYVRVTSVVAAGKHETYDVHHHPEHKIAANGAYVRQCAFCAWGQAALTDLRVFSEIRVLDEIEWFGKHNVDYLDNADANYGIVKRDIDLTRALAATKAKHGYPKTFRTSFAKNSNETIWEIANILHDAKMLKSVTLAMQSMDDGVLVNIKRKNIKFSKFGELIRRYEDAGIPTYTELILGLPGETFDMFLSGIDKNLEAGQHSGIFCYLNIMLENTEQRTPEHIHVHGLRTVFMQAMLTHGTPDDSVPREQQEIVVETSMMPHVDWKRAWLHAKVVEVFHAQGLLQDVAVALHSRGMPYRDFYVRLTNWCLVNGGTVAGGEVAALRNLLDRVLAGGSWDCVDPRLGEISWPPEEFAFARICCDIGKFYDEIEPFLVDIGASHEEIEHQRSAIIGPEAGKEAEWAREIVWYGRKGYARKKRTAA